jgi:predicted flavoprotein YhiN
MVLFDAETGNIILEYGGVQSMNVKILNSTGDQVEMKIVDFLPYNNHSENYIAIFFVGEILSNENYKGSYNYTLSYAEVSV